MEGIALAIRKVGVRIHEPPVSHLYSVFHHHFKRRTIETSINKENRFHKISSYSNLICNLTLILQNNFSFRLAPYCVLLSFRAFQAYNRNVEKRGKQTERSAIGSARLEGLIWMPSSLRVSDGGGKVRRKGCINARRYRQREKLRIQPAIYSEIGWPL